MDLDSRVREAIRHFWFTRETQSKSQGAKTGLRDQGFRTAVTGGRQLDGFLELLCDLLAEAGLPDACVFTNRGSEIPGFFRAEKQWDLLAVVDDELIAVVEFKSQVGPSFGNNYNNRTEEALGNATDLWAAYREGAFRTSQKPWLGYVMLLEETDKSLSPVGVREPHFKVFEEFRGASYAKRYELLLTKLMRERLYESTCMLLSRRREGLESGAYSEPSKELSFQKFAASLMAKAIAFAKTR